MQLCRHPSKGAISIHYIRVYRKPESKINTLGQYINYASPAPFHSCRKQAYETLPVVSVRRHPLSRTHRGLNPGPDPGVSCGDEHIFIQALNEGFDDFVTSIQLDAYSLYTRRSHSPMTAGLSHR